MPSLLAVSERELLRGGRRWQTWGMRALFAGVLLVFLVLVWAAEVVDGTEATRQGIAEVGRRLVRGYGVFQLLVLAAVTPVVVAQGVIEERDGGTLPLLAITRLAPARIVGGRLLARLVGLMLLAVAGLPMLALASSLGGVELTQIANLGLQSLAVVVTTGCLASFLGLFARGPFPAAMSVWLWCFAAWVIAPWPYSLLRMAHSGSFGQTRGIGDVSPLFAVFDAQGWSIFLAPLACVPTALAALALAAAGFRAMLAGADDPVGGFGTLSQDFAPLRKIQGRLLALGLALVFSFPFVVVLAAIKSSPRLGYLAALGWFSLAAMAAAGIQLLGARWVWLRRQTKDQRLRLKSSGQLIREWESVAHRKAAGTVREGHPRSAPPEPASAVPRPPGAPPPESAPPQSGPESSEAGAWGQLTPLGSNASEAAQWGDGRREVAAPSLSGRRARRSARVTRSRRLPFARQVWDDPVLWRELWTRAWGGLGGAFRRLYLVFAVGAGIGLLAGIWSEPPVAYAGAVMAGLFALTITLLGAVSTLTDELRRGTLPLLSVTPLSPAAILRSKLLAVGLHAAPAWAFMVLMMLPATELLQAGNGERLAVFAAFVLWSVAALSFLAVSIQTLALRLRTPPRIWSAAVLWLGLQAIGPFVLLELVPRGSAFASLIQLWLPLATHRPELLMIALSAVLWSVLTGVAFVQNLRLLRQV